MDQFLSALRERGVPEENLIKMTKDKVDQDIVRLLGEEELSVYIPRYGDRIFAKNWRNVTSNETEDREQRKNKLINRLRQKMKLPSSATETSISKSMLGFGNRNAERQTRKIELGWLDYQDCIYKQVRRPTGGGTRDLIVRKDDMVSSLLEKGKTLFFPNGRSKKGKIDDFEFMLCLMGSEEPLDNNVTIGHLYEQSHHKILRIYLCTRPKDVTDTDLSDIIDEPLSLNTCSTTESAVYLSSSSSSPATSTSVTRPLSSTEPFTCRNSVSSSTPEATLPSEVSIQPQSIQLLIDGDDEVILIGSDPNLHFDDADDTLIFSPLDISVDQAQIVATTEPIPSHENLSCGINTVGETPTVAAVLAESEDHIIPMVDCDQASTMARDFFEDPENIAEKQIVVIRSVHCVVDMVEAFADNNILDANISFRRILEHGEVEGGVGSGIIRDILSDFWNLFYATKTCGTTYKIPSLHHTFQKREWAAVARILAFGWQRFQYLPVQLAPPFLMEAFSLSSFDNNLMEVFYNFISPNEKDVLTEALDNFKGADMEELLSILSSHNCSVLPTEENLPKLVEEIAHKELVQEPAFIIKCWQPLLQSVGESIKAEGLNKILDNLKPRARNVTKCIQFPKYMSDVETVTSNQLLRFIRERDEKELSLFLRFCTGSDLFLSKTIIVTFTDMSEFTRRPLAHTCSCSLELPCNYSNYAEFRSEFCSVLKSGVWVMDML